MAHAARAPGGDEGALPPQSFDFRDNERSRGIKVRHHELRLYAEHAVSKPPKLLITPHIKAGLMLMRAAIRLHHELERRSKEREVNRDDTLKQLSKYRRVEPYVCW